MTDLMLWISAVDRSLLARTSRETAKFVGIGGAVLMTAVIAFLSMSYALHVALHAPIVVAVALGALWGIGILNLDRWIITATRRQGRWYRDVAAAVPRLMLAIVIGAVISEPLVLRIFAGEIETQISVMQSEEKAAFESALLKDPRYAPLAEQVQSAAKLESDLAVGVSSAAVVRDPRVAETSRKLDEVDDQLASAEAAVSCEGSGTCGSGTAGAGPVFEQNKARRDRLAAQQAKLSVELDGLRALAESRAAQTFRDNEATSRKRLEALTLDIDATTAARGRDVAAHDARVGEADGLLARISALHVLTSEDEAMRTARWGLFLFMLLVECLPVLIKLLMNLMKPSPYEQLLQAEDDDDRERAQLRRQTALEEARMEAEVALDAAEVRARTQLDAHVQAARTVLDAQLALVRETTEQWRAEQSALLRSGSAPVGLGVSLSKTPHQAGPGRGSVARHPAVRSETAHAAYAVGPHSRGDQKE